MNKKVNIDFEKQPTKKQTRKNSPDCSGILFMEQSGIIKGYILNNE